MFGFHHENLPGIRRLMKRQIEKYLHCRKSICCSDWDGCKFEDSWNNICHNFFCNVHPSLYLKEQVKGSIFRLTTFDNIANSFFFIQCVGRVDAADLCDSRLPEENKPIMLLAHHLCITEACTMVIHSELFIQHKKTRALSQLSNNWCMSDQLLELRAQICSSTGFQDSAQIRHKTSISIISQDCPCKNTDRWQP